MSKDEELLQNYCSILFTYKTIGISNLHLYYFRETEIKSLKQLINAEFAILQTCNRVEIYLYSDTNTLKEVNKIIQYLNNIHNEPIGNQARVLCGKDAAKHLFLVASGADSLSIGEYEILSQIRSTIDMFKKLGFSGKYLQIFFERAIKVGRKVREETSISKGKVGIYSLAIDEAKKRFNDFYDRRILVIGAGEMAQKITSMLHNEGAKDVTIMNRTIEKAKQLALKFGYNYEKLDLDKLGNFDVAFISIYHENLRLENKWNTLIVDITVPPLFTGNNVITLEELERISNLNFKAREEELAKINKLVEDGINELLYDYKKEIYTEFMSKIMKRIETIRENEILRAYKELEKLGINDQQAKEILDLMTRSIIKKSFQPLFDNIRSLIFNGENSINYINFLIDIFKDGNISGFETEKIKEKQVSERSSI
ncbi:glutamyl-tRNA reductase [Saccharolobus solfataricus]|uniref:Glutamyl-tRNA reductase n=3 Tax=Saccharolobus solfataricus TaxID=2287 RepID=HEM1_SACS2|nr:glutamyl-tRNA reductase [Saccharolobus solfataricus]Q980U7.1 RecName: Full=Glutamyl-tRNA reductase; Short=GluTR [Saccharolobus solfataricus P2]AAK40526.1 Glutamyl-tRNA reductase [Saccharolobus solfataricus P2]AKA73506.1 glutamyl-tRNA reductase [Saccharolobus solfataricus]AKA76204.1 glutamyl-tRNA reductase [Saccharolobus solfataricus]AKA78896.1 glutamyl-tRNA reductase [Saccharolobus solfataricus]AZF67975.1 glutamyl-tRNA reductase [Saccharolobus solfataricus]